MGRGSRRGSAGRGRQRPSDGDEQTVPRVAIVPEGLDRMVGDTVRRFGLHVEELHVQVVGRRRVVRIALDTDISGLDPADTGSRVPPLDLDHVARATRAISDAFDAAEPFGEAPYVLEVGSPGVDRPLTEPRHFRRNVGRLVTVRPLDGEPVHGRIVAADAEGVTLAADLPPGAPHRATGETDTRLPYAGIARARVEVEFGDPALDDDDALEDDDALMDDDEGDEDRLDHRTEEES